jgi:L-asparagine transporter-like permease
MNDPQHIFSDWRTFFYIINIPFIIFLLYYAINLKKIESRRYELQKYQRQSDSTLVFVRIVCVVTAIFLIAVLARMASL